MGQLCFNVGQKLRDTPQCRALALNNRHSQHKLYIELGNRAVMLLKQIFSVVKKWFVYF